MDELEFRRRLSRLKALPFRHRPVTLAPPAARPPVGRVRRCALLVPGVLGLYVLGVLFGWALRLLFLR
jgi:hypothetical protein